MEQLKTENEQLRAVIIQSDPDFFKRKCRVCGCDWNHPCNDRDYWIEKNLCSVCAKKLVGWKDDGIKADGGFYDLWYRTDEKIRAGMSLQTFSAKHNNEKQLTAQDILEYQQINMRRKEAHINE